MKYFKGLILLFIVSACFVTRLYNLNERMTHIDGLIPLCKYYVQDSPFNFARRMAGGSTYAPGQFLLTKLSLDRVASIDSVLYHLRLPSAILNIVGLLLSLVIIWKIFAKTSFPWIGFTSMGLLLAFGLRGIIESQQGYAYACSLTFSSLLFLNLLNFPRISDSPFMWHIRVFMIGIVGAIGLCCNYQVGLLLVAFIAAIYVFHTRFFLGLLFGDLKKKLSLSKHICVSFLNGLFIFGLIYPITFRLILPKLNNGQSSPVWARIDTVDINFDFSSTMFISIIKHLHWTTLKLFSFTPTIFWPDLISRDLFIYGWGGVLLLFTLTGIFIFLRQKTEMWMRLLLFCSIMSVGAFLIGNLLGRFPLGSTRHSYILNLPILLAITVAGRAILVRCFASLSKYTWAPKFDQPLAAVIAALMTLIFTAYYPTFHEKTKHRFPMKEMVELMQHEGIKHFYPFWGTNELQCSLGSLPHLFPRDDVKVIPDVKDFVEKTWAENPHHAIEFFTIARRGDKVESHESITQFKDVKIEHLISRPADGSTELWGVINSGNGLNLSKVTIYPSKTKLQ